MRSGVYDTEATQCMLSLQSGYPHRIFVGTDTCIIFCVQVPSPKHVSLQVLWLSLSLAATNNSTSCFLLDPRSNNILVISMLPVFMARCRGGAP